MILRGLKKRLPASTNLSLRYFWSDVLTNMQDFDLPGP